MDHHTFGEIFQREPRRSTRASRSTGQHRQSYNEDLITHSFIERDEGDAHASAFPCYEFLQDAGILDDFNYLIENVGLTSYMLDESNQYANLTKSFVENFRFSNSHFNPTVEFNIYGRATSMPLSRFCEIIGVPNDGDNKEDQGQAR